MIINYYIIFFIIITIIIIIQYKCLKDELKTMHISYWKC